MTFAPMPYQDLVFFSERIGGIHRMSLVRQFDWRRIEKNGVLSDAARPEHSREVLGNLIALQTETTNPTGDQAANAYQRALNVVYDDF